MENPLNSISAQIASHLDQHQSVIESEVRLAMNPQALQSKVAQQMGNIEQHIATAVSAKIDKCLAEALGGLSLDLNIAAAINARIDALMASLFNC